LGILPLNEEIYQQNTQKAHPCVERPRPYGRDKPHRVHGTHTDAFTSQMHTAEKLQDTIINILNVSHPTSVQQPVAQGFQNQPTFQLSATKSTTNQSTVTKT